ncbi:TetR/AcrR family transcriptional regulator [Blastococcus goldschmidtiae]|uniref:TetR family transcriptional regulator n=1 Tax=Blastococcus goldschmidtiae TaxID=3075546 RepID=A0ABU2K962_9ACTN|nr:TetR family transcriptional regulator [Blastococcus sp. DSM 46792]MDT0276734.1 TetR family transcriptional regulator [Blastococcus sp. DSM 46792]
MARKKDQQARRDDLIAATRRRIVDQGLAPVRIRHIAAEAGLSPGLVSYYFPDLEDLFRAVYRDAIDRFSTQRREMVEHMADPRERLTALVRSGLPTGADDETCILLYEFHPQVVRNPAVTAQRALLYERQVNLYESVLEAGSAAGVFALQSPAVSVASNLVALEDAYGHHVVAGISIAREQAESHLLDYASTATGCDLRGA